MNKKIKNPWLIAALSLFLAALPFQSGFCACAVEGGVCGDPPTWEACCNPDKYTCLMEDEADYGTCVPAEDAEEE